jgi:hypothetical protein
MRRGVVGGDGCGGCPDGQFVGDLWYRQQRTKHWWYWRQGGVGGGLSAQDVGKHRLVERVPVQSVDGGWRTDRTLPRRWGAPARKCRCSRTSFRQPLIRWSNRPDFNPATSELASTPVKTSAGPFGSLESRTPIWPVSGNAAN